jgi:hypothetical protein
MTMQRLPAPTAAAPTVTASPPVWNLWHRAGPRHAWQAIATAPTQAEAAGRMRGSGDFIVLPAGRDPNDRQRGT